MPNLRLEARKAAQRNGLDPDVFERQIQQESGFRADAVSPKGARGVAQIMPDTARAWGVNPMDPIAALNASARNMAGYVRKYGGIENALRAYNAGPGAIEASRNYRETNNYVRTILGGRTPARTPQRAPDDESEDPETRSRTWMSTTPGMDNRAARSQLVQSFLGSRSADPVEFALRARELRDIAPTVTAHTREYPGEPGSAPANSAPVSNGTGRFSVTGPNPGRLKPQLKSFAEKVADTYGGNLTGLDGSTHSKLTVNGNVSQHSTGNATDIFTIDGKPATGQRLINAGRAALIAAGMPRAKAMRAPGGLYNVGGHQIIFGVDGAENGGNHMDHLHISAR
jgi:hypothetical protein